MQIQPRTVALSLSFIPPHSPPMKKGPLARPLPAKFVIKCSPGLSSLRIFYDILDSEELRCFGTGTRLGWISQPNAFNLYACR